MTPLPSHSKLGKCIYLVQHQRALKAQSSVPVFYGNLFYFIIQLTGVSHHLTTLQSKWGHLPTFNPTNISQLPAIPSERVHFYFSHLLLGTSEETRNLSLGIPCFPAQHFVHELGSKEDTVTVQTDLMKAIIWKTAEGNKFFSVSF